MPRFQVQVNRCKVCDKTVYPMEELIADNNHYHKPCFKCHKCSRTLSTGTYASLEGEIFCKPHFLQLFKQKGNYEEGFGKERHKNKWNDPNFKPDYGEKETIENGNEEEPEHVNGVNHDTLRVSNGNHDLPCKMASFEEVPADTKNLAQDTQNKKMSDEEYSSSPEEEVEEPKMAISLEYKKSKLFENVSKQQPEVKLNAVGKLGKWEPATASKNIENTATKTIPKTAPKKLATDWHTKGLGKSEDKRDDQPEWVKLAKARSFERSLSTGEVVSVKNKFETGDLGKKDHKPETRIEIDIVAQNKSGVAQSTKTKFETVEEKHYETSAKKAMEELKLAKLAAKQNAVDKTDEEDYPDARVIDENNRYRELEEFRKNAAAKQNLSKFQSGSFSTLEQQEVETRKEVESILGSGKAGNTLRVYETGSFEKSEYVSPVKQELSQIKSDAATKKNIYEQGPVQHQTSSEAKKELEIVSTSVADVQSKFQSGAILSSQTSRTEVPSDDLIRSGDALEKKKKFESGELLRREFSSDAKRELETIKVGAADIKSKIESGEILSSDSSESEVKKELENLSTGAKEKKNKYESGDFDPKDFESVARKEAEELKKVVGASMIKSQYEQAVEEAKQVVTSKPVTIEKGPAEEQFVTRNDDEDLKITYVPRPEPKKLGNVDELFKKPEVEKEAPAVSKLKLPSFDNKPESDEEVNGHIPDDEELAKLKEGMWPKKAANLKSLYEAKSQPEDLPKEPPKQIDLQAEIED